MKKSAIPIVLSFLCVIFFSYAGDAIGSMQNEKPAWKIQQKEGKNAYDLSTILVKFKEGITKKQRYGLASLVGGKFKDKDEDGIDDRYEHILGGRLALIELKGEKGKDLAFRALRALQHHPFIEYAEYNYLQYIDLIPNDRRFDELWGLHNTGQTGGTADADIDAPEAWDISAGSSEVIVGVIDTGIDYGHKDLAANIWTNPDETPGNGVDDDGNGYVDDIHGINAITGSGDPMDDHSHGTHCSGTIGAVGDNSIGVVGVAGVNCSVKLIGMKFLNSGGSGSTANAIKCVNYAVALKNSGVNIRVLSNSWGGGPYSQALGNAIGAANKEGILFVASAGNSSSDNDTSPHYPSSYGNDNVLAVASTDRNDDLSSFSCYGLTSVDLGAPGSSILSTIPGDSYSLKSGTSMATPHVAGAAALLLSVDNQLAVQELKNLLMDCGDPLSALDGKCVSGKRLNVSNSLTFGLWADPTAQSINQGEIASYTINIESGLGFSGDVNLSASSNPAINPDNITFTPNPGTPGFSSSMNVDTTATDPGEYLITVTGESGSITNTKTTTVTLVVTPDNLTTISDTNESVLYIPDNDSTGITSTIEVSDSLTVWETSQTGCTVNVNITHTYIGDLFVKLTSPSGTESILHNRTGGWADNIHQTYYPTEFRNENCQGTWTLSVSDNFGADLGTLDSWTLTIDGIPTGTIGNAPPNADFTFETSRKTALFFDNSYDLDGNIVSWSWDFGDGTTSNEQDPVHRYKRFGTYTVTLTVTDNDGATDFIPKDDVLLTK